MMDSLSSPKHRDVRRPRPEKLTRASAFALLASLIAFAPASLAQTNERTPVGYWKTVDDKAQQPRSIVKIWEQQGQLHGKVERLLPMPGKDPDRTCTQCEGKNRGKRVRGMEILWGFKRDGTGWSDGSVLDPESGNVYHANLEVLRNGKQLRLFGYVRIIIKIGRTQTWERVKPADWGITE